MRRSLILAALLLFGAGPALGDDTGVWKAFKGKIIVSDQELGAGYASDGAMIAGLKRLHRTNLSGDSAWTLNLMVFLKQPSGASQINIVYYDVTKPKAREQVYFVEVEVQPTQKTVSLNGIAISKEQGFVKGHKYEVLATRLVGGKEDIYARATITLK